MSFEYMITTEEIREKMFDFLNPEYRSKYDLDVDNINWTDGVYDSESGIFLTLIYYVSDGISRCDIDYYSYIAVTDKDDIFKVDNNRVNGKGWDFSIPEKYTNLSDKIKEGIEFYRVNHYKSRRNLSEEQQEELEEIEEIMYDRCHKCFQIRCEEDALKLFELHRCNEDIIYNIYNRETSENFRKYATDENVLIWRGRKYTEILMSIIRHSENNEKDLLKKKYGDAIWYFGMGTDDTYDELFYKAVKSSVKYGFMPGGFSGIDKYIERYIRKYPDKVKNLEPLLDFLDKVEYKDRYLEAEMKKARKLIDEV